MPERLTTPKPDAASYPASAVDTVPVVAVCATEPNHFQNSETAKMSAPVQALILAAGRGSRLAPYTDTAPTALIEIAGKPMIAHSVSALRRKGVVRFVICRGWQGAAFDDILDELGEGVVLVDCPDYASTGMLESMRNGMQYLSSGGFYVVYGDILFRPSVVRQLCDAFGAVSVVVNVAKPGHQSKGLADVEVVTTCGEGSNRIVRRIGKSRGAKEDEIAGEFGGLVKISANAQPGIEATLNKLWQINSSCTGETPMQKVPWWMEPIQKASLCDFLQLVADDGGITPVTIFNGWHEVNTPQDLIRARNDTATFLSEEDTRAQVAAMGACLLSEANDLKRPLQIVAQELNISLAKLECLLRGDLEVSDALDVLRKMSEVYPVPLNDLWLDADDTVDGVRLCTLEASEASSRILNRQNRSGSRTPYYEYRDAAMSRCSQFRPEWIKQLRIVQSGDPLDPDVQLNNGHLMMQTTLFIGPVDFYWKDCSGTVQRREMQTGDSNFISPFVPHSFTSRDPSKDAIIVAVTYGGSVRRAFTEFTRVGAQRVMALAGDKRDLSLTRKSLLRRHLDAECLTDHALVTALVEFSITPDRISELLEGREPTHVELEALATVLNVRLADLHVSGMTEEEEVVVTRAADSIHAARQLGSSYVLAPLARTRHQPDLKTFDMEVRDSASPGESLHCGLHTFVYHFGSEPVELSWEGKKGQTQVATMRPGDSAYVAPLVEHRFSVLAESSLHGGLSSPQARRNPNGIECGKGRRLLIVRIPGHLTGETLAEFATFSAYGRERVGAETEQWYT